MRTMLFLACLACSPLERVKRGTEGILDALGGCLEELTEADIVECGEAVLDPVDTLWECHYRGEGEVWEVCGTREEIQDYANADSDVGRILLCDRVDWRCNE